MDSIGTRFRERIPPIATKVILTASRIVFFPNEFIFLILFVNKHINSKGEEADAAALYKYASDPRVGPVAGWPPHGSVAESLDVIRTVFAAPETYAAVLRETGEPVGSMGIMFGESLHSAAMKGAEAEIGYWIGVPYWGRGLVPEAVERLLRRCFEELGLEAVWCGHYEGTVQSRRVMEKCGFVFHHTEYGKLSPLGDLRTEHFLRLTAERWRRRAGQRDIL